MKLHTASFLGLISAIFSIQVESAEAKYCDHYYDCKTTSTRDCITDELHLGGWSCNIEEDCSPNKEDYCGSPTTECVPYSIKRCKDVAALLRNFTFVSAKSRYRTKGCYSYTTGKYANEVYYGMGGNDNDRTEEPSRPKFRPPGLDCTAIATCTDGIQNGNETGTDCGGGTCPACATCTDGIQNGNETGTDCGGGTCPACGTTTIDCDAPFSEINAPETRIISPNYPLNYGSSLDCQTTIRFPQRVSVKFISFNTESKYDWLEIRDGDNANSNLIGSRISGLVNPTPKVSTGNAMTVIFHTDGGESRKGFELQVYEAECADEGSRDRNIINPDCYSWCGCNNSDGSPKEKCDFCCRYQNSCSRLDRDCEPYSEEACIYSAEKMGWGMKSGSWTKVKGCYAYEGGNSHSGTVYYSRKGTADRNKASLDSPKFRPKGFDCYKEESAADGCPWGCNKGDATGEVCKDNKCVCGEYSGATKCTAGTKCKAGVCANLCTDTPSWENTSGFNCEDYENSVRWCKSYAGWRFNNPEKNCCACGKKE